MINEIIKRLEKEKLIAFETLANTGDEKFDFAYLKLGNYADKAIDIVREVAEKVAVEDKSEICNNIKPDKTIDMTDAERLILQNQHAILNYLCDQNICELSRLDFANKFRKNLMNDNNLLVKAYNDTEDILNR